MERRRALWRRRWARLFGAGIQSRVLYGDPWAMAYRIGPHPELLGRRVASLRWGRWTGSAPRWPTPRCRSTSTPGDPVFPTRVTGALRGVPFGEHRDLAVAVNGRIRAVGRSFDLWRRGREFFSMMVPETSLRAGRNRLEVFEVRAGGAARAASAPVGGVRLGARIHVHVRRALVHVDERAEVAPAVVAGHAGAEEPSPSSIVFAVSRLRISSWLPRSRMNSRKAFALRSVSSVSDTTSGTCREAGDDHPDHAGHQQAGADPVGEHLALGLAAARRARRPAGGSRSGGPATARPPRSGSGCRRSR